MPSFDVVSKVNMQEIDNAINQARKEMGNRYDFRGSNATIEWKAEEQKIQLSGDDEFRLTQVIDILQTKLIKRDVPLKNLEYGKVIAGSGTSVRQDITVLEGIPKEKAKEVTKLIKNSKLKVQSQIMDDQVRVTGKKIDDLQDVIAMLKNSSIELSLQFTNMRN